jgi:hypothetical protein
MTTDTVSQLNNDKCLPRERRSLFHWGRRSHMTALDR